MHCMENKKEQTYLESEVNLRPQLSKLSTNYTYMHPIISTMQLHAGGNKIPFHVVKGNQTDEASGEMIFGGLK